MNYRRDVDGLRAVAVLAVVFGHLDLPFFDHGYVGVDIFFVISGFLITKLIMSEEDAGNFSFWQFYERRIRRILPALLATIVATGTVGYFILLPHDYSAFANSAWGAALSVSNVTFLLAGGYFTGPSELKPLLHTWSLGVEEQFYVVAPLVLVLFCRFAKPFLLPLYVVTAAISCVAAILVAQYQLFDLTDKAAFFLSPFRGWELMAGGIIAIEPSIERWATRRANLVTMTGLGLIVLSVAGPALSDGFPGASAIGPVLGASLVIAAGSSSNAWVRWILANRVSVFVGRISYSLYLVHWPMLSLFRYFVQRDLSNGEKAGLFILAMAFAYLSWRFIEVPFRQPQIVSRTRIWVISPVAALVVIGLAVGIRWTGGLDGRFNDFVAIDHIVQHRTGCKPIVSPDGVGHWCIYGNYGGPIVALVGDSHAMSIASVAEEAAGAAGIDFVLMANTGCPPLIGVDSPSSNPACARQTAQIFDTVKGNPQIATVVLASRWAVFSEGGSHYGGRNYLVDHVNPANRSSHAIFADGLFRTLQLLQAAGKKTVLIGPIPEQDFDVERKYRLAKVFDRPLVFGVEIQNYEKRTAFVIDTLVKAERDGEAVYLDPRPEFCSDGKCWASTPSGPLYSDDNHLSYAGAMRLLPLFASALRQQ